MEFITKYDADASKMVLPKLDVETNKGSAMSFFKLPANECPHIQRRNCPLCGVWQEWIFNINDPKYRPTSWDYEDMRRKIQAPR